MIITFYDVNINSDMNEIFHLTTTKVGNNDGENADKSMCKGIGCGI